MGVVFSRLAATGAWKRAPDWQKFGAINLVAHLLAYWGPNVLLFAVARFGWLLRYKLQKDSAPAADLVRAALKDNILNDLVVFPLVAYPLYKLLTCGGDGDGGSSGIEKAENQAGAGEEEVVGGGASGGGAKTSPPPLGWAGLQFDNASRPSPWTTAWQVAVGYFGYDFMFYWSHRLLHSKLLYKAVHKQHHLFRTPIGISSSYQHVVEGLIQMFNWYLPIGFAGWLNKRLTGGKQGLHISSLFAYNIVRWLETVDAHCGYVLPFSPFARMPWLFGGAAAHDLHHSGDGLEMVPLDDGTVWADFGNYGASVIWDKLMGTFRTAPPPSPPRAVVD